MKKGQAITTWVLAGGLMLIMASAVRAQQPVVPKVDATTSEPSILPAMDGSQTNLAPDLAERQEKLLNSSRQKRLVLDTQRLVALANELKAAVDKSDKDTLSLDVIRKADEVEKLAHSVKEKMMKGS
jgi:hypothetical protein